MRARAWRHSAIRTIVLSAAVSVPTFTAPLAAQVAAPSGVVARAGETVRVRTQGWMYTGTLARVTPDTAVVTFTSDSAIVPRADILRMDVQRGTRRSGTRILLGVALGIAGGAVIGGYTGVLLECGRTCDDDGEYAGLGGALAGISLGSLVGGLTGGTIAAQYRVPRWLPAELPERAP